MEWLWIDLANSDWRDRVGEESEDRLANPKWRKDFLKRWSLPALSETDERDLTGMRDALRRAALALSAGDAIAPKDLAHLNRTLASTPVVRTIIKHGDDYRLNVAPPARTTGSAAWQAAMSFAEFLETADPTRLRLCDNCRWVFVDETRSRTRRWCDAGCGNVIRLREFRERHRTGG